MFPIVVPIPIIQNEETNKESKSYHISDNEQLSIDIIKTLGFKHTIDYELKTVTFHIINFKVTLEGFYHDSELYIPFIQKKIDERLGIKSKD